VIDVSPHQLLYVAKSGSQLFGTATPSSDLDVKGVFLPSKASLYLQTAPQQFSANTNPSDSERKNTLDDVDITVWSLQFWMKLVLRGDINAVSLLFAPSHPDAALEGTRPEFVNRLRDLEPRKLLTRDLGGMMGFAHSQAIKYSDKGKHLRAVRIALEHLGRVNGLVGEVAQTIVLHVADDHLARIQTGERGIEQLLILEKAFDFTARADWAVKPLQQLEMRYGKRASGALESGGVDFKAFSHSLRVLEEMRLLHETARITYPHEATFATLLRDVKLGRYEYDALTEMLDKKLEQTRAAEAKSLLPEAADLEYAQGFILSMYDQPEP
jgi:RNA repair pathway DNA polymerase beta family